MTPKATPSSAQYNLFQVELSSIITSRPPLVRLSAEIAWDAFNHLPQPTYAPVVGAPGITTRLMVALHYLKFQYDLSDENVVAH
jgi:IS5 family transposase